MARRARGRPGVPSSPAWPRPPGSVVRRGSCRRHPKERRGPAPGSLRPARLPVSDRLPRPRCLPPSGPGLGQSPTRWSTGRPAERGAPRGGGPERLPRPPRARPPGRPPPVRSPLPAGWGTDRAGSRPGARHRARPRAGSGRSRRSFGEPCPGGRRPRSPTDRYRRRERSRVHQTRSRREVRVGDVPFGHGQQGPVVVGASQRREDRPVRGAPTSSTRVRRMPSGRPATVVPGSTVSASSSSQDPPVAPIAASNLGHKVSVT